MERAGWMQISRLPNLAALLVAETIQARASIDNSVIRAWASATGDTSVVFPRLILLVLSQTFTLEKTSLEYLRRLPRLSAFGANLEMMRECSDDIAHSAGWKSEYGRTFSGLLPLLINALGYHSHQDTDFTSISARLSNASMNPSERLSRRNIGKYFRIVSDASSFKDSHGASAINVRCGTDRSLACPGIKRGFVWYEQIPGKKLQQLVQVNTCASPAMEGRERKRCKLRASAKQDLAIVLQSVTKYS